MFKYSFARFSFSRRMIESISLLSNLLNEREEEFVREKVQSFVNLLDDSRQDQEVCLVYANLSIN
jgi:hypothetical protein